MGDWVIGAFINLFGSIAINFGTNLLKLGHNERERQSVQDMDGANGKLPLKPIIYFHTWRVVYTPDQLAEKYSNITFLFYCLILILIVALHHAIYRRGELLVAVAGQELRPYWHMLLPFSYAIVSGAVGSCSVLFAKSLSNLLRLAMSSSYQLHSWFTYSMLLLFLSTAGFWVFDALRTTMFILGMTSVFVGISLLAPDESRGGEVKDNPSLASVTSSGISSEADRLIAPCGDGHSKETRSFMQELTFRIMDILVRAKNACSVSLGFTDVSINASAVLVMPMVSSKITGFRGTGFDRSKVFSMKNFGWSRISLDEEGAKMVDSAVVLA